MSRETSARPRPCTPCFSGRRAACTKALRSRKTGLRGGGAAPGAGLLRGGEGACSVLCVCARACVWGGGQGAATGSRGWDVVVSGRGGGWPGCRTAVPGFRLRGATTRRGAARRGAARRGAIKGAAKRGKGKGDAECGLRTSSSSGECPCSMSSWRSTQSQNGGVFCVCPQPAHTFRTGGNCRLGRSSLGTLLPVCVCPRLGEQIGALRELSFA